MHSFGWKPSPPDQRDYQLRLGEVDVPAGVDLRPTGLFPPIWDQANLGSCVPHGGDRAAVYALAKEGTRVTSSQLFSYWNGRSLEGTTDQDSGMYVRDICKALNKWGLAPEEDWPYDTSRFTETPPSKAYSDAAEHEATVYAAVAQDENQMKSVLASGFPIIIGFTVYESFESAEANSTGQIPMPGKNEGVLGGHCMLVVGYGTDKWIMANSWGTGWGDNGYCYMPMEYLLDPNLSDDFWMIKTVSGAGPTPVPPSPSPAFADADKALRETLANVTGEPITDVRHRDGISDTFKSAGVEVLVKNLHP
jgi:C1A family cysteine protease